MTLALNFFELSVNLTPSYQLTTSQPKTYYKARRSAKALAYNLLGVLQNRLPQISNGCVLYRLH